MSEATNKTPKLNVTHPDQILELYNLWQFGDWHQLSEIDTPNASEEHLALKASAQLQLGQNQCAKDTLGRLNMPPSTEVARLLISGVFNTLGRAHAILGDSQIADELFDESLSVVTGSATTENIKNARKTQQLAQLGIPSISKASKHKLPFTEANMTEALKTLSSYNRLIPEPWLALAELAQRNNQYEEAIRLWQNLAEIMNEKMPQRYYDQLDEAYQNLKSFPLGTEEEEKLSGQFDKHEFLKELHQELSPRLYLEIGVQTGKSLKLANCKAIGVDPMPRPNIKLAKNQSILRMTSDTFFNTVAHKYLQNPPDLVFIDGMHLYEFVLRDFINVEKHAADNTLIVIDDIFPGHPTQANRDRKTRAWTGDVWKIVFALEAFRPELTMHKLDAFPTGLLLVSGFKKNQFSCANNPLKHAFAMSFNNGMLNKSVSRDGHSGRFYNKPQNTDDR